MNFKMLILSLLSFSALAGVGGIAGSGNKGYQLGSQINFLKEAIHVNALYSKTLCHDRHDFQAVVEKCVRWGRSDGERICIDQEKTKIFQPKEDYKDICGRFFDGDCVKWVRKSVNQSPKRLIEIKNDKGDILRTQKVIVPECHQ